MAGDSRKPSLALAEKTGLVALLLGTVLFWPAPRLAVAVLVMFVLLCFLAPFFPGSGFFLPVISRGNPGKRGIALTFDDGPDPDTTPRLLDLLASRDVCAAFFVTGKRAQKYPELIREILAHGHEVANHTFHHDPLIMLKPAGALSREVHRTRALLAQQFGIDALALRPPVGIVSPRLGQVLKGTDMFVVNFNRRAGDRGNRRIRGIARRIMRRIKTGDIVLLHDIRPHGRQTVEAWLLEVTRLLDGLSAKGFRTRPLSTLIGRPVMITKRG